MARRYDMATLLPSFTLVGLCGWDDFLVRDVSGKLFTVPTVPLVPDYLRPLSLSVDVSKIQSDPRFTGRIKWYILPLIFGGDPGSEKNITWISADQHVEAVRFWNSKYREAKSAQSP